MSLPYLAVFIVSAATLVFEIALTRIFSVAQGYHFAFMAVSLGLLGFGASGTILAVLPRLLKRNLVSLLFQFSVGFTVSVPLSYLVNNYVPFDSYQIALDPKQYLYLAVYYLSLVVPFLFAGLIVGAALAILRGKEGQVYSCNLAGSGLGCLLALLALTLLGGEGTILLAALGGAVTALLLSWHSYRRLPVALSLLGATLILVLHPFDFLTVRMSPYKALANALRYSGSHLAFRQWNAFSRVDVVEGPGIRSAPGLSPGYLGEIPPQLGLTVDGDNLQPITAKGDLTFLDWLPNSLPYLLVSEPRVLILEPGGGLEVLLALSEGAGEVVAVQSNPLITYLVRDRYGQFTGGIFKDPRVALVGEIGRSYLARTDKEFDLIVVSLTDSYRPVTSGAYSLQENYTYTREAFVQYLRHLAPEGILVVPRWLQLPPSEEVRALALAASALEEIGVGDVGRHIVALRSFSTSLLLAKPGPFTEEDIEAIREFAEDKHFDMIWYPGMGVEEANKFYILKEPTYYEAYRRFLETDDKAAFYSSYPFDVSPPTDNRPFFFHFFTWRQIPEILRNLGRLWQPFGGSGYLVLWGLLILALLSSTALVVLPLFSLRTAGGMRGRILLYFLLLGIGYLFVEMPLMQRLILFLGHPVYAMGVVLFSLLTASGLGSLFSGRVSLKAGMLALALAIFVYPILLPRLFEMLLGLGLALRLLLSMLLLAPLGTLMGMPFPKGISVVTRLAPGLVPWAWAINGCASVLSSILAAMVALSYGFSWVMLGAGVVYLLGLFVINPLARASAGP